MQIVFLTVLAVVLGQLVKHLCVKLPDVVAENITYKEFTDGLFKDFKIDFKYSIIFIIFSLVATYYTDFTILKSIYYLLVFAVLAIVFSVDYRFELIPDECQVALILLGVIKILVMPKTLISACIGAVIGFLIFYLLGKLALLIFKKEGMGFGDVKLMTGLGLIFGAKDILVLTLVSFVIGAVISILLMIFSKKGMQSYIPFGPFIVIAAVLIMFVPASYFIMLYVNMCAMLAEKITDVIFNLFN